MRITEPKPTVLGPRKRWAAWRNARTRKIEKPSRLKRVKKEPAKE